MIKVLVVDDHDLSRLAVKTLLKEAPGIHWVGEASTGEEGIVLAKDLLPDVAIVDVDMPGIGGLGAIPKMLSHNPRLKILVLTIYKNEPYPSRLMQAGAHGYLTKGCKLEELIQAIHTIYEGGSYISPAVAQQMVVVRHAPNRKKALFKSLSKREFQIMLLIVHGEKAVAIAKKLSLNIKTVNTYRYHIFQKLNINNDVELTLLAVQYGIIEENKGSF